MNKNWHGDDNGGKADKEVSSTSKDTKETKEEDREVSPADRTEDDN
jgi:hypothetical protein